MFVGIAIDDVFLDGNQSNAICRCNKIIVVSCLLHHGLLCADDATNCAECCVQICYTFTVYRIHAHIHGV